MTEKSQKVGDQVLLERAHFQQLLDALGKRGYKVAAPTVRDGAIIYDEVASVEEFPIGWTDEQGGGRYRLKKWDEPTLFGYVVGPQSWKKYLFPPEIKLWEARKSSIGFQVSPETITPLKMALVGVRACELQAIAIQDKVFSDGEYVDPIYLARRDNIFILAINCTRAGENCFCASMKTGPKAGAGFDLALTEILDKKDHHFVVEVGSKLGAEILSEITIDTAGEEIRALAEKAVAQAAKQMGRSMDTTDIKQILFRNLENPRWDEVAERCLGCSNCTMVCPTCFCMNIEDYTDLKGSKAERRRKWDSCFTLDHSYIHGGSIRNSSKSRYRQWLTHKLAYWIDQFGTSGCVGCGRCITWCPVGIDITEEVRAIRESTMGDASALSMKEKSHGKP
jgi:ferredoxin